MHSIPESRDGGTSKFQKVVAAFLTQPGLPFASVLSAERVERVFAKHGNLFGMGSISTILVVWAFLGQVLREGKEASCQAAVAKIVTHQQVAGLPVPTSDTGDYCRLTWSNRAAALRC